MYIFCQFHSSVLGKVLSIPGVSRIVGFGGRPAEVSADEIEALQRLAQSNLVREPWTYIPDGTLVRVETGPLAGMQGIISSSNGKGRLVISVTLLHRSVAIQLDDQTLVSVIEVAKEKSSGSDCESEIWLQLVRRERQ